MALTDCARSPTREARATKRLRFRVTTINWTYASERGDQRRDKVHRNVYEWSLPELIAWIRRTADVAQDIVGIEPIERPRA